MKKRGVFLALILVLLTGCATEVSTKEADRLEIATSKPEFTRATVATPIPTPEITREVTPDPTPEITPIPEIIPEPVETFEPIEEIVQEEILPEEIIPEIVPEPTEEVIEEPVIEEIEPEPVEDYTYEESLTYVGDWTITFYCDCAECVGQYAGLMQTASGNTPSAWYTVAAGYSYPFGTELYIEGLGYFVVQDRGVPDGWADIYVNDHSEIPSYGMTTASVYIVG